MGHGKCALEVCLVGTWVHNRQVQARYVRIRSWKVVKIPEWVLIPLDTFEQGGDIITAGLWVTHWQFQT